MAAKLHFVSFLQENANRRNIVWIHLFHTSTVLRVTPSENRMYVKKWTPTKDLTRNIMAFNLLVVSTRVIGVLTQYMLHQCFSHSGGGTTCCYLLIKLPTTLFERIQLRRLAKLNTKQNRREWVSLFTWEGEINVLSQLFIQFKHKLSVEQTLVVNACDVNLAIVTHMFFVFSNSFLSSCPEVPSCPEVSSCSEVSSCPSWPRCPIVLWCPAVLRCVVDPVCVLPTF